MKAVFIKSYYFQGRKYLEYEYKDHRYSVCADWNAESLSWQHKSEQDLIDREIESQKKNGSESASIGLEIFFKSVGM